MSNTDIQALLNGTAAIQTKIEILPQVAGESSITLTESNGIVSWDYEDFRFIKDQGFIGQFIAKQVTGTIKNPSDTFSMTDREFKLQIGIKVGETVTWYSLGNFLVTKITDDEVGDTTKFEALDYTKKFNKKYEDTITYPCTMLELVQNICEQCGCELGSTDFKHKDWVIDGNYFQNNESCRDVMKNLGKLAYSWVRVDWDNKVYFDFTKKTTVESYNKITNHEYYSLKTQKDKNIVNRVVIGYSNIDGEQTKVEDTASIEANGLCEITIFDNPLVYSQALREKAIIGASDLLGLEYTPLETQTIGHPWLKGYELIETVDMEGNVHKTIPFNRTIQYFGHIKSLITIETNTKTNTEYAYESGLKNDFLNAQIQVDKKLGKITSTVDEMNTKVEDITTTTQTSTGGNSLYLKEALASNALEYSIDGKCLQKTRSGKNLLDMSTVTSSQGIISKLNNDGSVMISGTASSNWSNITTKNSRKISTGTYTLSTIDTKDYNIALRVYYEDNTYTNFDIGAGSKNQQITLSKEVVGYYIYIWGLTANTLYDDTLYLQLEKGSNTTEWEQYGTSPSPDYPSEIKTIKGDENGKLKVRVTEKNLANIDNFQVSGGGVSNPYNQEITNLKDNTPYILSFTKSRINGVTISNNALFTYHSISYYNEIALISSEQNTNAITLSDGSIDVNIPIITPVGCNKIVISFANWNGDTNINTLVSNIQLEQNSEVTYYEPYKEKEVLIDLAKNNLFDKNNANILNVVVSGSALIDSINSSTLYIECEPNTTYTVSRNKIGKSFRVAESSTLPVIGGAVSNPVPSNYINEFDKLTIATSATAKYLLVFYSNIGGTNLENNNGYTEKELRDSIKVYKGTNADDSYELNSIGDTKDKLEILNGVVDIQKKIGKIVLNGSEEVIIYATASSGNGFYIKVPDIWYGGTSSEKRRTLLSNKFLEKSRNEIYLGNNGISYNSNQNYVIMYYDSCKSMTTTQFKSWLQANPVTIYYELREPEPIILSNINIPLYEDVNHVTLVEDLETNTSIKYLRKTPISGEYALNQDLNKTNSNLADTNNQLNQAQSDISSTNTNLNNNYYNKEQVDSINSTTTQQVTQIRNTVEQTITSTEASISKIQETIENGVSKITTTTGTFDENGLNISKSGQQMSSTLDWDGLEVVRDKGKATETEVLTVRSAGVEAENMTVRNFFIAKPIRIEKCKSITDSTKTGLGFFWIGE